MSLPNLQGPGMFAFGVEPNSYDLPHPALGLRVILLIRLVLAHAFSKMRDGGFDFAGATEDEITTSLKSIIENDLRQNAAIPGFNKHTFESVQRQAQASNYDNTKLAKTPDLCFKRIDRSCEPLRVISEHNALFIECKPVDDDHPIGTKYCQLGLARYIVGEYSWAMRDAAIVAYVRHRARTLQKDLQRTLDAQKACEDYNITQKLSLLKAASLAKTQDVYLSKHKRKFEWLEQKGPACEITIFHLWFDCY